ncbi:MAG: energy transducer TonB [Pseudomonadota bacterium]
MSRTILLIFAYLLALPARAQDAPAVPAVQAEPATSPGSWITDDDYPAAALRAGESGAVAFRLTVDAKGAVVDCAVTEGSGSAVLDTATCALLRERARFHPAKDKSGKAASAVFASRIRWELPKPLNDRTLVPVSASLHLLIGSGGRVLSCYAGWDAPIPCDSFFTMIGTKLRGYFADATDDAPIDLMLESGTHFDQIPDTEIAGLWRPASGDTPLFGATAPLKLVRGKGLVDCGPVVTEGSSPMELALCQGLKEYYATREFPEGAPDTLTGKTWTRFWRASASGGRTRPLARALRPLSSPGSWITDDDYPSEALETGEQGKVGFALTVDAHGTVTGCTVTASSHSDVLDKTACRLLLARATFSPGTDAGGKPIPAIFHSRIRWQLPAEEGDGQAPIVSQTAVVRMRVGSGGRVYSCERDGGGADALCLSTGQLLPEKYRPFFTRSSDRAPYLLIVDHGVRIDQLSATPAAVPWPGTDSAELIGATEARFVLERAEGVTECGSYRYEGAEELRAPLCNLVSKMWNGAAFPQGLPDRLTGAIWHREWRMPAPAAAATP